MAASGQPDYLAQGGYPREIFKDGFDDKYLCNFCSSILREPVQSFCGHRFCKSCMEANISSGGQIKCTQCEKEDHGSEDFSIFSRDQIFPDNAIKREMFKLKVSCANAGCSWQGIFKQFEEHYTLCEYKQVICPDCGSLVAQKRYPEHESTACFVLCQHCGERVLSKNMQEHLLKECKKSKAICDQCGREVIRELLNHHQQTECQAEKINCPVGCGTIERKHFHQHYRDKKHDVWFVQEFEKVKHAVAEIRNSGPVELLRQDVTQNTAVMNDKITALERQVQELLRSQNESGAVAGQGIGNIDTKIRQAVELQLQSVNERLDVKTGTFEGIASALHRELEKTITAVEKLERHRRESEVLVEQNQNKLRSLERSIALKDMTMAELELKAQSMEAASFDGTFMWRVSDFNKKHQDALHGRTISIYSPPFYTSRRGYKMCARLYPNGDGMGKGSHLSLFFVVMRGNYDALLKWPFSQRVTFCMINQNGGEHVIDSFRPDPQSSSFKRPTSDMNIASGCPLFIRLEMLQNPNNGFLKDDTMFLKVAVDTTDVTDPISSFEERIKPQS